MSKPKIVVYSLPGLWDLSSISPFCLKLETWLKMVGLPFENGVANPRKSPRGKFPWITVDGVPMTDSQLIIDSLGERMGTSLEVILTPQEAARSHAIRRWIDEAFYWLLVELRWNRDENFAHLTPVFDGMIPGLLKPLVIPMIRRKSLKQLHQQGIGRYSREQIDFMAEEDVEALARLIGDGPYVLGDKPSVADASVWANLANVLAGPIVGGLRSAVERESNLMAYVERGRQRWWK